MGQIPLDLKFQILAQNRVRDLADYIGLVYQYVVGIAGIFAVALIMWGGMKWIFAAGDAEKVKSARGTIENAVIGLVLVLSSYLILNTINPNLVNLRVPPIKTIDPMKLLAGKVQCPNTGQYAGKYQCGQNYDLTDAAAAGAAGGSVCIGTSCLAGTGGCYQRMGRTGQTIIQFACVDPAVCGSNCNGIKSQELCESSACWNRFRGICYWEGTTCYPGKEATQHCENDYECKSQVCNKAWRNSCAKVGGDDVGTACSRDLDCGCYDIDQAGTPVCKKLCFVAGTITQCILAKTVEDSNDCNRDQECKSGYCNKISNVTRGTVAGAVAGGGVGFLKGCAAGAAAGALGGSIIPLAGTAAGGVIGCLGGGLLGGSVGATLGGAALGAAGGYLLIDGECQQPSR